MANMIADIRFAANTWVDVYAATGFAVGTPLLIVNKLAAFDALIWEGATPPGAAVLDGMPARYPSALKTTTNNAGCWAYYPNTANSAQGRLCVQEATS